LTFWTGIRENIRVFNNAVKFREFRFILVLTFIACGSGTLAADSLTLLEKTFPDIREIGNGWHKSEILGLVYPVPESQWAFHQHLGFIYLKDSTDGGVFIFLLGVGWWWTDSDAFPYIYRFGREEWGFLDLDHAGDNVFFIYSFAFETWNAHSPLPAAEGFPYHFPDDPLAESIPSKTEEALQPVVSGPAEVSPYQPATLTIDMEPGQSVFGRILWGDGTVSTFTGQETLTHAYRRSGDYELTVYFDGDISGVESIPISVGSGRKTFLNSIDLDFSIHGGEFKEKTTAFLGSGNERPNPGVQAEVAYHGAGGEWMTFDLLAEDPDGTTVKLLEKEVFLPFLGGEEAGDTVSVALNPQYPLDKKGIFKIWLEPQTPPNSELWEGSRPLAYYAFSSPDPEDSFTEPEMYLMQTEAELAQKEWERDSHSLAQMEIADKFSMAGVSDQEREKELAEMAAQKLEAEAVYAAAMESFSARYPNWRLVVARDGELFEEARETAENEAFPELAETPLPDLPVYRSRAAAGSVGAFPLGGAYLEDLGFVQSSTGAFRFFHAESDAFWRALDKVARAKISLESRENRHEQALLQDASADSKRVEYQDRHDAIEARLLALDDQLAVQEGLIDGLIAHRSDFKAELEALLDRERDEERDPRRIRFILSSLQARLDSFQGDIFEAEIRLEGLPANSTARAEATAFLEAGRVQEADAEAFLTSANDLIQQALSESDPGVAADLLAQANAQIDSGVISLQGARTSTQSGMTLVSGHRESPCEPGSLITGPWGVDQFFAMRALDIGMGVQGGDLQWHSRQGLDPNALQRLYSLVKASEAIREEYGLVEEFLREDPSDTAQSILGTGFTGLSTEVSALADMLYEAYPALLQSSSDLEAAFRLEGFLYRSRVTRVCEGGDYVFHSEEKALLEDPSFLEISLPLSLQGDSSERKALLRDALTRLVLSRGGNQS